MLIRKILTISSAILMVQFAFTQDVHFSQYYNTPLNLNPALAGSMDENYRITANYRNQWSQILRGDAYNAYNIALERKITTRNGDAFGIGINGFADRAGELNYGSTQGQLALAYHKSLGRDSIGKHTISLGAQFGITERKVDLGNARWPSQHDGNGGFDPSYQPPFIIPDVLHTDIGIGLNLASAITESFTINLGAAAHHLNKPNISFYGTGEEIINVRYTLHGEANLQVGEVISFIPRLLFIKQGGHKEITPGIELGFKLGRPRLRIGHYFRTHNETLGGISAQAIITTFGMDFDVFRFGLSYDVPTSNERIAGQNDGGIELTTAVRF